MKKLITIITIIFSIMLFSCDGGGGGDSDTTPTLKVISGKAEKGALQKGATITAAQWSASGGYSGKVFNSETLDNQGAYTLEGSTISGLLDIKADGFFINENTGTVDSGRIIISGLYDSESQYNGNINIVTHIIKQRVINLIKTGKTFDEANNQAVTEFYSNFNWTPTNPLNTSIASSPELLLLSAALCKDRTVDEVSDILTAFTADMADGVIDVSILDDSFYNLDVSAIQNNMIALYGSSPLIGDVKNDVIAFRSISGPPPKIYIVSPAPSADFYYFTETKSFYKYIDSGSFSQITMSVTIKQDGFSDIVQNFTLIDFFKIGSDIYFTANIDGSQKYMVQNSGIVSFVESSVFPEKPVKNRVEMNNGDFSITSGVYDIYPISDVRNLYMSTGISRTSAVTDYFIADNFNGNGGMFFVADDKGVETPVRSGLYFYQINRTFLQTVNGSQGEMWK